MSPAKGYVCCATSGREIMDVWTTVTVWVLEGYKFLAPKVNYIINHENNTLYSSGRGERKKERKKESLQNAVTSWNITVIFSSNRSYRFNSTTTKAYQLTATRKYRLWLMVCTSSFAVMSKEPINQDNLSQFHPSFQSHNPFTLYPSYHFLNFPYECFPTAFPYNSVLTPSSELHAKVIIKQKTSLP